MRHYLKQLRVVSAFTLITVSCGAVTTVRDTIHSNVMQKDINYVVNLPNSYATEVNKTFPVLYCLHGLGAPHDTWAVMSPLNAATDGNYPAILVTFDGSNSWYVDNAEDTSVSYTTFFFEELVPFIESQYRAGGSRELRAVTGFSMGGFGAWHYMLERPDFFSSVSSLSGAFNRTPGGNASPYTRLTQFSADEGTLPPTYMNCGTSDGLISDNRNMAQHLTSLGYSTVLIETEGGKHDWTFWKNSSAALLEWHYQYFSEPMVTWMGYPIGPDEIVDTGNNLGLVYVKHDPWVWMFDLESWISFSAQPGDSPGHWGWLPR